MHPLKEDFTVLSYIHTIIYFVYPYIRIKLLCIRYHTCMHVYLYTNMQIFFQNHTHTHMSREWKKHKFAFTAAKSYLWTPFMFYIHLTLGLHVHRQTRPPYMHAFVHSFIRSFRRSYIYPATATYLQWKIKKKTTKRIKLQKWKVLQFFSFSFFFRFCCML